MKLSELIHPRLVFPDLPSGSREDALKQITDVLAHDLEVDSGELYTCVMDRERVSSTGIGSGIAIPHAKLSKVKKHLIAVGRSRGGIDFKSIDGMPVHLIFMIVGPAGANEVHLKILARISRFLHDTHFRDRLITAESGKAIHDAILEKDEQY